MAIAEQPLRDLSLTMLPSLCSLNLNRSSIHFVRMVLLPRCVRASFSSNLGLVYFKKILHPVTSNL
jgi:hypothetical protein